MTARPYDPHLVWDAHGSPHSRRFDDIYFNPLRGPEESRYVFLQGCGLPDAWRCRRHFAIGETGFGTGLNFLVTWQAWHATRRAGQYLHYLAVEGFPLDGGELLQASECWPALNAFAKQLQDRYPLTSPGYHRIHFDNDGLTLTLLIGDIADVLGQLEAKVDAWYLDGFAPQRNPAMWCPQVLRELARLSAPGARMATFTAAGSVRRNLQQVGFAVTKAPGFGSKRERLLGRYRGSSQSACPPWYRAMADPPGSSDKVTVIGGGVAAACVVTALARRGISANVIAAGDGASANPRANVAPRLSADKSLAGRFLWSAYRYALNHWASNPAWRPHGSLLIAGDAAESARQARLSACWSLPPRVLCSLAADAAGDVAGIPLRSGGLWFPESGMLDGAAAIAQWPIAPSLARVESLVKRADEWLVRDARGAGLARGRHVIVACGLGARAFPPTSHLPLYGYHGQISFLAATAASRALRTTVMAGCSLTPAIGGAHALGATFDRRVAEDSAVQAERDHRRNRQALRAKLPEIGSLGLPTGAWRGVRGTSLDRMPIAGPVVEADDFLRNFSALSRNERSVANVLSPGTGLNAVLALGAHGFTTAPLAAEITVSLMMGEPWPVERDLVLALHPSRFLVRKLKRSHL